jgi:hypothetical protein
VAVVTVMAQKDKAKTMTNRSVANQGACPLQPAKILPILEELRERADTIRADQAFTFCQLATRVKDKVTEALKGRQIPDYDKLSSKSDGEFVFVPSIRRVTPSGESARRAYSLAIQSASRIMEAGDLTLTRQLLNELGPRGSREDLRDFEWHYFTETRQQQRTILP